MALDRAPEAETGQAGARANHDDQRVGCRIFGRGARFYREPGVRDVKNKGLTPFSPFFCFLLSGGRPKLTFVVEVVRVGIAIGIGIEKGLTPKFLCELRDLARKTRKGSKALLKFCPCDSARGYGYIVLYYALDFDAEWFQAAAHSGCNGVAQRGGQAGQLEF